LRQRGEVDGWTEKGKKSSKKVSEWGEKAGVLKRKNYPY